MFNFIFNTLKKWNPKYFDPIVLKSCAEVYINKHRKIIAKKFPEYKDKNEEDELTKEYSKLNIKITHKDKYEYSNESWFKSTFIQEFIWAAFDNKINILDKNSDKKFVLGDMFVDAAMCYSQEQGILDKVKHKYSIESLTEVLKFNKECFHFWEGVICLLRSCYFKTSTQSLAESQDKVDPIKKGVFDYLNAVTNVDNIEQLGFATQAIMLVTNLYCRLNDQDKDQLNIIIPTLFIKLIGNFEVYAIPNAFDFVKGAAFLDQNVIENNRKLVDNEFNKRNVILETHQKYLILAIWELVKKIDFNQLWLSKVKYESEFLKSLNLESHMIEKFIVLFILNL